MGRIRWNPRVLQRVGLGGRRQRARECESCGTHCLVCYLFSRVAIKPGVANFNSVRPRSEAHRDGTGTQRAGKLAAPWRRKVRGGPSQQTIYVYLVVVAGAATVVNLKRHVSRFAQLKLPGVRSPSFYTIDHVGLSGPIGVDDLDGAMGAEGRRGVLCFTLDAWHCQAHRQHRRY